MKIVTRAGKTCELERVAIDLQTVELAVKMLSGNEAGAMKTFFIRNGTPAERLAYFNRQNIVTLLQ